MTLRKIIVAVVAVALIASVAALTVSGAVSDYDFKAGYSHTNYAKNTGVKIAKIVSEHLNSAGIVQSRTYNLTDTSKYLSVGIGVYKKSTKALLVDNANNGVVAASGQKNVGCTDYRSINKKVYYVHSVDVFGSTTNPSSSNRIANRIVRIGYPS